MTDVQRFTEAATPIAFSIITDAIAKRNDAAVVGTIHLTALALDDLGDDIPIWSSLEEESRDDILGKLIDFVGAAILAAMAPKRVPGLPVGGNSGWKLTEDGRRVPVGLPG